MTHPQPPSGPQDPQQPNPEPPAQPFPATPQPQFAADPTVPQTPAQPNPWSAQGNPPQPPVSVPPVSGAPQSGVPGQWTPPTAPQPPYANEPQPPYAHAPYPAAPDQPWSQPPVADGGYPPPGGAYPPPGAAGYPPPGAAGYPPPGAAGYPPAGGAYPTPGGPGYPPTVQPPAKNSKTVLIIAVTAAVLALLCCAGGIVAVVVGANRVANEVTDALPTPGTTGGTGRSAPNPSSTNPAFGEAAQNMPAGRTLQMDDDRGVMKITVDRFSTSTEPCRASGLKPSKGTYVIADVTVSVVQGTGSINPLYFWWIAADGTKTSSIAGVLSGCGKSMPSGTDLPVGTTRTGTLVFNVPDTNGVLEYQHRFKAAGTWKP
ncbi:hypothetical protein [Micromonospora sp. NPDC047527]|uniref:hypothetical protein n=1 Tax=unclassified Micromonospora TaxID=2617518 RepID=UPI0033F301B8